MSLKRSSSFTPVVGASTVESSNCDALSNVSIFPSSLVGSEICSGGFVEMLGIFLDQTFRKHRHRCRKVWHDWNFIYLSRAWCKRSRAAARLTRQSKAAKTPTRGHALLLHTGNICTHNNTHTSGLHYDNQPIVRYLPVPLMSCLHDCRLWDQWPSENAQCNALFWRQHFLPSSGVDRSLNTEVLPATACLESNVHTIPLPHHHNFDLIHLPPVSTSCRHRSDISAMRARTWYMIIVFYFSQIICNMSWWWLVSLFIWFGPYLY